MYSYISNSQPLSIVKAPQKTLCVILLLFLLFSQIKTVWIDSTPPPLIKTKVRSGIIFSAKYQFCFLSFITFIIMISSTARYQIRNDIRPDTEFNIRHDTGYSEIEICHYWIIMKINNKNNKVQTRNSLKDITHRQMIKDRLT